MGKHPRKAEAVLSHIKGNSNALNEFICWVSSYKLRDEIRKDAKLNVARHCYGTRDAVAHNR